MFDTLILKQDGRLIGPWRTPRQMLNAQSYGGHASIHDDATARTLGFQGGTIEGPTHYSQLAPLCVEQWGETWFSQGSLSVHYRAAVFEPEEVRAMLTPDPVRPGQAQVRMEKRDGTEVLAGTASCGPAADPSALDIRFASLKQPRDLVILRDVRVGMKTERMLVVMGPDQYMGDLYPFTLQQKLAKITEPSPLYERIIPMEMVSVLLSYSAAQQPFPARTPAVGLFIDQEIRILNGPIEVGVSYEIEREVVGLSASRRTESLWVRTLLFQQGGANPIAAMLLNNGYLKESYPTYQREYLELYGTPESARDLRA